MLYEKAEKIKNSNIVGPEKEAVNSILDYASTLRHLGNKASHFQVTITNVMDTVIAVSTALQMCYTLLIVNHLKKNKF